MTAKLAGFQPSRLQAAARKAVDLHPNTADALGAVDASSLATLRQRVQSASGDAAAVTSLANELSPREVRHLITGLEHWRELRTDVLHLLGVRLRSSHMPVLWQAWQRLPQLHELIELMGRLPPAAWIFLPTPYAQLAPAWIRAPDAGLELQGWLDARGLTHSDLPRLGGARFALDTPLARLVHEAVLTHGSASQLRREGQEALVRTAGELPVEGKRMLFGRNYLRRFESSDWSLRVLEAIRSWYGLPRRPRFRRFWDEVPEALRDAFQRFFVTRTLGRAFGDDDRGRYWKRWLDHLDDAHEGNAGETPYVVLLFPNFGVVEFFRVGNAAYFYSREKAESFASRRVYAPSALKEVQYPIMRFLTGNRLIHHANWEMKADRLVDAYRRHFGGR